MKKLLYFSLAPVAFVLLLGASLSNKNPYGMKRGTASVQSISAISFGPEGILFIGDSKSATVFAVDTKDKTAVEKATAVEVKDIDKKIAAALGTETKNIRIQDMAVNPISKKIYFAVQVVDGTPVVLTLNGDKFESVNLKDIVFSQSSIANVPGEDAKDKNGRSLREQVISDLNYADGSVMLSGISNQEFGSTFRKIAFPFSDKQQHSTLEIYHTAHGRYETSAPIRTFTTAEFNGKKYIVASYTCTPLVLFPMDELQPGKHVKGRTVAELGGGNSPIDMVTLQKDGITSLLMANTNRPVMRINYDDIKSFEGTLTEHVKESYKTAGIGYVSIPVVNVLQMDKLDETQVLVLQRKATGDLDLWTVKADRWL
ncbi:MAG TPA: hypothetical protein VGO58_05020 [Chitinophagaceae bacterium]|jgi:hypothetical protein|nr:hypothetical protein [Chitinophagaceae bacterium]